MKELEHILALWSQLEANGESAVLATVVKTSGSSYRLPGARLLLTRTGQRVGSVSGGCLEDDLVKKAWWLTENGPVVRRYDTTPDGEIAAEYGLGCNGIIHLLLERVEPGRTEILDLIRQVRETRQSAVVAHVIAPADAVGQRTIQISTAPRVPTSTSGIEVVAVTITPPLRLLVFGAGDDAIPLVRLAKFLGWQVFVFDGRAHYARRDKFPEADEVFVRAPGSGELPLPIDRWTAAVLMSHSYSQDLEMLKELANRRLCYLGALGPRKRALQMLSDAAVDALIENPSMYSPMGLEIGADGPEQVALSVVAEIQATLNGRAGGSLRDRAGSIHAEESNVASENAWVQSIVCA
jgi:xanthine/CO dehydrogenase XdhC/CoxF family maturation factor